MPRETAKVSALTADECVDVLAQCYMVIDTTEDLINKLEARMSQLELEVRLGKPFLALVNNENN